MIEVAFDFKKFIHETKSVIIDPAGHFSDLAKKGGFTEPVIKAVIYGLIAGLIHLSGVIFFLGGASIAAGLITSVAGSVIALFIGGAVLLVISAICGGGKDYETNVRVNASLMVIYPLSAVFGLPGDLNFWLEGITSLIIYFFAIWLIYNALIKTLGGIAVNVRVAAVIMVVLALLIVINNLHRSKDIHLFMNQMKMAEQERENRQKEIDKKFNREFEDVHRAVEDMQNVKDEDEKTAR